MGLSTLATSIDPLANYWYSHKFNLGMLIMREIEIKNEPIELYKLLKAASLLSSGGEAKFAIADGQG